MVSVIVLTASLAVFRGLGWAGIEALDTWPESVRAALAAMFVFTGLSHFSSMRHDFARMVPALFAQPMAMVYFTGVCELFGAVGILIPGTREVAGISLAILLVALLPGNIRQSQHGIPLRGKPPTPLGIRIAIQILFVVLVLWSTQS